MEIKANSSDLLKALNHIHGIVEVRHTLPILSNIVLSAENNELSLSSTNLDIFCSDKIDAEIVNSGEISVPAITFFEIVKRLPSGSDVILSMGDEDTELILKCGRSKFNLSTLKTEDFPILSDKDLSTNFVISADELSRMIDKTKFAISNEETRYYLNGIFFHKAESNSIKFLRAVATDGHRLAQYDIPLPQGAEEITGIIIPKKTVFEKIDPAKTLVFDEIDSGISGLAATKVASHLVGLSKYKQVLCITHLAQIASQADHHLHIDKYTEDQNTYVNFKYVTKKDRTNIMNKLFLGTSNGELDG